MAIGTFILLNRKHFVKDNKYLCNTMTRAFPSGSEIRRKSGQNYISQALVLHPKPDRFNAFFIKSVKKAFTNHHHIS
jgi:hypothetical protein